MKTLIQLRCFPCKHVPQESKLGRKSHSMLNWQGWSVKTPELSSISHFSPDKVSLACKWMLHTGGGWGETPPPTHMIVKRFGCTTIHNKALYKCLIHSFIHSCDVLRLQWNIWCFKSAAHYKKCESAYTCIMFKRLWERLVGCFFSLKTFVQITNHLWLVWHAL